jgi:primosomal protein N'
MRVQVALSLNIFEALTYEWKGDPGDIRPGTRVVVPVGNRMSTGWIIEIGSGFRSKTKPVYGIVKGPLVIDDCFLHYTYRISMSYFCSQGVVLDYSLPPHGKSVQNLWVEIGGDTQRVSRLTQRELQRAASDQPLSFSYRGSEFSYPTKSGPRDRSGRFSHRLLLDYSRLAAIEKFVTEMAGGGGCVLLTAPDHLTAEYYARKIPGGVLYDSSLKTRDRAEIWTRAVRGELTLVVGGLLATMLPLPNLGGIVSDRSGSLLHGGYRSFPGFHVHHLAETRALAFDVPFFEGSPGYTVSSYARREDLTVTDGRKNKMVNLTVHPIPVREKMLPPQVLELVKSRISAGKRLLLIVNKKTSSRYLYCAACRRIQECPQCAGVLCLDDPGMTTCRQCDYRAEELTSCSRCGAELTEIQDVSAGSMKKRMEREVAASGVKVVTADDISDPEEIRREIASSPLTISTPVLLNPFFSEIFDALVYFRPEAVVDMNDHLAGEQMQMLGYELKELVRQEGTVDIFSTFHFHYGLRLQEEDFFARELKYRQWFKLPPFYAVYGVHIRSRDLRSLGKKMRNLRDRFGTSLHIEGSRLISRKRVRGFFRGQLELHAGPEEVRASGILEVRDVQIQLQHQ